MYNPRQPSTYDANYWIGLFIVNFVSMFMALLFTLVIVRYYVRESTRDAIEAIKVKMKDDVKHREKP
jgi:hypothetical protein